LILVLASVPCQLLLTLLENSPFCTVFHINIWFAILGGTTIILESVLC
jgi:hypothetical protein